MRGVMKRPDVWYSLGFVGFVWGWVFVWTL